MLLRATGNRFGGLHAGRPLSSIENPCSSCSALLAFDSVHTRSRDQPVPSSSLVPSSTCPSVSLLFGDSSGTSRLSGKCGLCRSLITATGRMLSNGGAWQNNTLSWCRIYSFFSGTHRYFHGGPDSRAIHLAVWLDDCRKDIAQGDTELETLG